MAFKFQFRYMAFIFLWVFAMAAKADLVFRSGRVDGPVPYAYMVAEDADSDNTDIVYVFHGGNGDESQVRFYAEKLAEEWKKLGYPVPRFAGLTFGRLWLLAEKNASDSSGLMEVFVQDFMPKVESEWFTGKKIGERHAVGFSMGGLNALNLSLRHPELLKRVGVESPALVPLSPFASEQEILDFAKRTGAPLEDTEEMGLGVRKYLRLLRDILSTESEWLKISPADQIPCLAALLPKEQLPKFFITGGREDIMYYPGAENLYRVMQGAGWPFQWKSLAGGHHSADREGLASFLRSAE